MWHTKGEVGRLEIEPIKIEITNPEIPKYCHTGTTIPCIFEGRRGLKPVIEDLLKQGTLEPSMPSHNTSILPVRKSDGSYHLVQELREINQRTITQFPVVANPYTLLSKIAPSYTWYSVVDLKDAFWSCPLDEGSRGYFVFEWEYPETGRKQQLRWTVLPQGFTESPNLFGPALERMLQSFEPPEGMKLLQYVDDLLIAGGMQDQAKKGTVELLNFLKKKKKGG